MLMSIFLTSLRTDTQLCFTEKNVYINVISFFFFYTLTLPQPTSSASTSVCEMVSTISDTANMREVALFCREM